MSAKTANYTLGASDSFVAFDPGNSTVTATLPSAVGTSGTVYRLKNVGTGTGQVNVATTSSQTIDSRAMSAGTQIVLAYANTFLEVVSDGADWISLGSRETVAARYSGTTSALTGTTFNSITFSTKSFDSHGAYKPSGVYTVPVAGKYSVVSSLYLGAGAYSLGTVSELRLTKNGTEQSIYTVYSGGNVNPMLVLSDMVQCAAGDSLLIQARSTGSSPGIANSTTSAFLSVVKIGD